MVRRTINAPDTEPEQMKRDLPSPKEHLFQVSDIFTHEDEIGAKLGLDQDTVSVKCEVVGGDEEGRTLLNRLSLDPDYKGFFATRLFLKAVALPHKGQIDIETDDWQGLQFYATVKHNDGYANIDKFNFDKMVEETDTKPDTVKPVDEEIAWDDK